MSNLVKIIELFDSKLESGHKMAAKLVQAINPTIDELVAANIEVFDSIPYKISLEGMTEDFDELNRYQILYESHTEDWQILIATGISKDSKSKLNEVGVIMSMDYKFRNANGLGERINKLFGSEDKNPINAIATCNSITQIHLDRIYTQFRNRWGKFIRSKIFASVLAIKWQNILSKIEEHGRY